MRRSQAQSHPARPGFTLIELLVVILIIAVLVGLTTAAVMRVKDVGPRTVCRAEIAKLDASISAFCTDFGVDYIPSRIVLREDGLWGAHGTPAVAALEVQSLAYLKKVWPRLAVGTTPGFAGHDWNSDGAITTGDAGAHILEGDQCLVFFLGGARVPASAVPNIALVGFSVNREYPMLATGERKAPHFTFQASRLRPVPPGAAIRSAVFVSYFDAYDRAPYAYFSSRSFGSFLATPATPGRRYEPTDCSALGLTHYVDVNGRPYMPDGHQIICAGRDGTFGPGGVYNQATGAPEGAIADDMANFHQGLLGGGTQ